MAEGVVPFKLPADITKCPICRDVLADPRMLPCIHTFCLSCIANLSQSTSHSAQNYVECPLCREEHDVSDILNLPKNLFIGKLVAVRGLSPSSRADPKKCDWCKVISRKASRFCPQCREYLCNKCVWLHSRMPPTRQHRAFTCSKNVDNDTATKHLPLRCDKHLNRDLEVYCFDCKDTVCLMCFVTQHSGHKSSDVKEVAKELKNKANGKIFSLIDRMRKLDSFSEALQVKKIRIEGQVAYIEEEIRAKTDEQIEIIDLQKQQLLFEVDQRKAEKIKAVDNAISDAIQNMAAVASLVKYSKELLTRGSNSDIMRESKSLAIRTKELMEICDNVSVLNTSQQMITFFTAKSSDATNFVGEVEDTDYELFTHSTIVDNSITALALLDCLLFIAHASENDNVSVYDTATFRRVRLVTIADCIPYGLAACSTYSCLYLSGDSNKIHTVSLSTYVVASSWSTPHRPRGLSVTRSHHLLVAYAGSDKIHELSHTGALLRELSVGSEVWQVVELNNGKLVASTTGPFHGVCLISADGKVLGRFGSLSPGCKAEQMKCPRCVAVDKQGYVVVADYMNNRVLVLNPALSDKRVFRMSDGGVCKPVGLWFDESRGRLYVGESVGHNSRLLAFDNVFNLSNALNR